MNDEKLVCKFNKQFSVVNFGTKTNYNKFDIEKLINLVQKNKQLI